ncbi:MAG TPA: flagellar biosynthesis anti-sigma factor FlgM [bacterium]|nr:flagellar biosynthesis anti-sigma factor FlgM [bacterium]
MRIDGFQNIPAVLQSLKSGPAPKTGSQNETVGGATSVSLSSFAEVLQNLQREAAQAAAVRNEKVEQLSQQVQSGKLSVDLGKLASKLVESQVINPKG